ncbi:cytochrome P450 [Sphaerisporangium sp. TRM90804]|uniref:cytochrome P450 n=1 Tax=Sphaerisporangium sp. TRM90804 TaxID=3031113 RepID=UPI0024494797|nr:cytochrome P450 [Sphaerisporangium sp. TRM90804]MDH2429959.1 cytochrome P450 [Sphaerisporangium sp. TRM90804]
MSQAPYVAGDVFTVQAERVTDRPGVHERLRRAGPVVRVDAFAGGPAWVVTDDSLAREVLADPRFSKDPALAPPHWHGREPGLEPPAAQVRSLTTLDGPEHRRLRAVHAPLFTRARQQARRDRVAAVARELLTEAARECTGTGRPVDLVTRFTSAYPLIVVCDFLGLPLSPRRTGQIADAAQALTRAEPGAAEGGFAALQETVAAAFRDHEAPSPVDAFAERARAEMAGISDEELLYLITGMIFAGQVTTESFLGFLIAHQLAGHLDSGGLAGAPSVEAFVSEALRLHPPAPFTLWRFTTVAAELAGVALPAGAPVLIDIEGTGTDPARHPRPFELDPGRPRVPDLTFGSGPHACIGAQLALLEACVAVEVLRDDFPKARLAVPFEELRRDRATSQARRLESLPVWL